MESEKAEGTSAGSEQEGNILQTKMSRRTFLKLSAATAAATAAVTTVGGIALKSRGASNAQSTAQTTTDLFAAVPITLTVNGIPYSTTIEPRDMLVNVLRENLSLTGTKRPCDRMECGGCTVIVDGKAVYSCTTLAMRMPGHSIETIEANNLTVTDSTLAALQAAWVTYDASQCGYCQPGRLMAATALLKNNTSPTVDQIKAAVAGNLCRCGTYNHVIAAIQAAAASL